MKPLGKVKCTARGFDLIMEPGISAIWLGCDDARAHLDRKQVEVLIAHLQAWLDSGTFALPPEKKGGAP